MKAPIRINKGTLRELDFTLCLLHGAECDDASTML
jgi:hypothetical protein